MTFYLGKSLVIILGMLKYFQANKKFLFIFILCDSLDVEVFH